MCFAPDIGRQVQEPAEALPAGEWDKSELVDGRDELAGSQVQPSGCASVTQGVDGRSRGAVVEDAAAVAVARSKAPAGALWRGLCPCADTSRATRALLLIGIEKRGKTVTDRGAP